MNDNKYLHSPRLECVNDILIYHSRRNNESRKWKKATAHKPRSKYTRQGKPVINAASFTKTLAQQPVVNDKKIPHSHNKLCSREKMLTRHMVVANEEEIPHSPEKTRHYNNILAANENAKLHSRT